MVRTFSRVADQAKTPVSWEFYYVKFPHHMSILESNLRAITHKKPVPHLALKVQRLWPLHKTNSRNQSQTAKNCGQQPDQHPRISIEEGRRWHRPTREERVEQLRETLFMSMINVVILILVKTGSDSLIRLVSNN